MADPKPSLSEGNFKSVRALNAAKRYMETHSSHPASRSTGSAASSVSSSAASSAGSSSCGLQEGMKIEHQRFGRDRKSTRLNSSHVSISYAVFCLKKKNK